MLFFLFGIVRVLKNMRALTGASYSFRFVHKEMRSLHSGRQAGPETGDRTPEEETQEDYATYRDRQKKHADAPGYLIISALFLILSLAMLPLC